jgi:sugar phosphate isomerase/epimerase
VLFDAYGATLRIPDLSATGRREFLHVLSNESQQLVGLQGDLGPKGFGPGADVDRLVNGVDRAMEAARALGSPLISLDLGPLPEPPKQIKPTPTITPAQAGLILLPEPIAPATTQPATQTPPPDPKFVGQVDGALSELGARADRYGVVLAFRSELSSFAAIDDLLRRVRCPWFGLDLDPVAVLRDEWPLDDVLSRFGGLLRHVRGRDATKGADRRTKPAPLGRGDTNWPHLLASLDDAAYAGWVTVDPVDLPDRAIAAASGLAELRKVTGSRE